MSYRIFTDVCSDLPLDCARDRDISVMPMLVTLDEKDYYIDVDPSAPGAIAPHDFYERLRAGGMAKTAQLTPTMVREHFEDTLKNGQDILYIAFSSGLSGTCANACMAAQELMEDYPGRTVRVVDSLSASLGQGLLAVLAADARDAGVSLEEAATQIEQSRLNVHHWFTVDDLMFLRRGGRLSGASAVMGTMLSIKPVLVVDDEGHLPPRVKVQGRKRALKTLVDKMADEARQPITAPVMIAHGDVPDEANLVAKMVKEHMGVEVSTINTISPIIGCHSGPGTVALFFLSDKPR